MREVSLKPPLSLQIEPRPITSVDHRTAVIQNPPEFKTFMRELVDPEVTSSYFVQAWQEVPHTQKAAAFPGQTKGLDYDCPQAS